MFGYVLPVKGEMKVSEYESYRAAYCGLCKQLQKSYGFFSRFLLNYDLVLLAVIADAVSGEQGLLKYEGCFVNPLNKRAMRHNTTGLQLAADGLMMLSYHKLCDNLADETYPKKAGYLISKPYFKAKYKKVSRRYPKLSAVLEQQMARQQEIEHSGCTSLDLACDPTAQMCGALFKEAGRTPDEKELLQRIGLFAGQIVYLLDAAEDYPQDKEQDKYNVFVKSGKSFEQAVEAAQQRCRLAAGEIAISYSRLVLPQYKSILDNIFYLGIPAGITRAGIKRTQRRADHGQISGV